MDPFQRELHIHGHLADLPGVIDFVESSAEQAGIDNSVRFELQLAVEEACTNVIEHAYGGQGGEFVIRFETSGTDVLITILDQGRPFNPEEVHAPDMHLPLEQRQIGGLGLHLMTQLMDEVRFTFSPDGNTLVMVKRSVVPARRSDAA